MPILTCRYCRSQCLDRDVMKIYDDPEGVSWFSSHYVKCSGVRESQKCECGDLSKRCLCDECDSCIKVPNIDCDSIYHPKTLREIDQIRKLEGVNTLQESEDYLAMRSKILRLRNITPLEEIVKTSRV